MVGGIQSRLGVQLLSQDVLTGDEGYGQRSSPKGSNVCEDRLNPYVAYKGPGGEVQVFKRYYREF